MHSTVQTGLFSQNLFGQQSNDHQYHNYASSSSQSPSRYVTHQPPPGAHNHHHYYFQPPHSTRHRMSNTSREITASLLAIDTSGAGGGGGGGDGGSLAKSTKLNMSSQNISKLPAFVFLSSTNLDRINTNSNKNISLVSALEAAERLKKQSSSSSSIIGQIVSSNSLTRNISANFNDATANGNVNHLMADGFDPKSSISNPNQHHHYHMNGGSGSSSYPKRSFWDCTKPCGMLTTALGITLLVTSALAALFLLESSLCTALGTCSNALVTLYAFSALVCGIVLVFIGMVIVVYTKKDVHVIVTTAKNFDKIVHYKQQQQAAPVNKSSRSQSNNASNEAAKSGSVCATSNKPASGTAVTGGGGRKIYNQNHQMSVDVTLPDSAAASAHLPLLDPKSEHKQLMV